MHILLLTATGAENLGDELITLYELKQLSEPNTKITVLTHDAARTQRFFISQKYPTERINIAEYFPKNIRKKIWKNIALFWKNLVLFASADAIYIGGGGLLYSANEEGRSPIKLWFLRVFLMKILRKKIIYLSLGVSTSTEELQSFGKILFKDTIITVRDVESQERINHIGFPSVILPDPVFLHNGQGQKESKTVGIAFRGGHVGEDTLRAIIKKLLSCNYSVVLLPHSLHPGDERSHDGYYLQDFLLPGVTISQSIEQTLTLYSSCHIILAMRLHSMILAICHHIPFIGVSYSKKTESLLSALDWKYTTQSYPHEEDIWSMLENIDKNYNELCEKLENFHTQEQRKYLTTFGTLCK